MQIFNTTTKESQIIDDDAKIPKGWTDQKPLWVLCETFNGHEWVEDVEASRAMEASIKTGQDLARSDLVMARVLEDLIAVLIEKGTITVKDLPASAQAKLSARQELRNRL